jgi:hypothetical protein
MLLQGEQLGGGGVRHKSEVLGRWKSTSPFACVWGGVRGSTHSDRPECFLKGRVKEITLVLRWRHTRPQQGRLFSFFTFWGLFAFPFARRVPSAVGGGG